METKAYLLKLLPKPIYQFGRVEMSVFCTSDRNVIIRTSKVQHLTPCIREETEKKCFCRLII